MIPFYCGYSEFVQCSRVAHKLGRANASEPFCAVLLVGVNIYTRYSGFLQ